MRRYNPILSPLSVLRFLTCFVPLHTKTWVSGSTTAHVARMRTNNTSPLPVARATWNNQDDIPHEVGVTQVSMLTLRLMMMVWMLLRESKNCDHWFCVVCDHPEHSSFRLGASGNQCES